MQVTIEMTIATTVMDEDSGQDVLVFGGFSAVAERFHGAICAASWRSPERLPTFWRLEDDAFACLETIENR
jgi:hypothetical protein